LDPDPDRYSVYNAGSGSETLFCTVQELNPSGKQRDVQTDLYRMERKRYVDKLVDDNFVTVEAGREIYSTVQINTVTYKMAQKRIDEHKYKQIDLKKYRPVK
jgi:hypothetical protein